MNDDAVLYAIAACLGYVLTAVGGLGVILLDNFHGKQLEAYGRLRKRRERFGHIIDHQDAAIDASIYLRTIGTAVFTIAGTLAMLAAGRAQPWPMTVWGVAAAGLLMLVHVWIPVSLTRFGGVPLLHHTWPFWRTLSLMLSPLAAPGKVFEWAMRRIAGRTETDTEDEEELEDEIRTIVTAGTREGYFGPDVREMITGVMTLHEETVKHIMTPRGEVDAIDAAWDWPRVLQQIVDAERTRFPVFEGTLDRVVGVLYVKDLLPILINGGCQQRTLDDVIRKPWTVPEDRSVELMLREFLHSRSHMAIVLDEYGHTAGVVTIEDALEEIVGEIVDESDEEEIVTMKFLDDDTLLVDGRAMLDDLNELTAWDLPESDDYETVAGYVLFNVGSIPPAGTTVSIGDIDAEVLKTTPRKIETMRLVRRRGVGVA